MPTIEDEVTWFLSPGDPRRDEIRRDPYPFYERLRTHDAVHKSSVGPWILTGYDAVLGVCRDDRWSRSARDERLAAGIAEPRPAQRMMESGMLYMDPPDHTRLRRLITGTFKPRAVSRWEERITAITDELLAEVVQRPSFDLLGDFALELPGTVICELIGLPLDRFDDLTRWAAVMVAAQEPGEHTPAQLEEADRAATDCLEYFAGLIEERRGAPGDDVISLLLEVQAEEAVELSEEEIVCMCILLHVAGYETTSNLITNGVHQLLRHPEQDQRLRADPSLLDTAIDEMLRFDSPGRNALPRRAVADMVVGDKTVPAGDVVVGVLGAANRDPARFDHPDTFDIGRRENRHIAFGNGIHYCVGAWLARAEARAAFSALYRDAPPLRLVDDEPSWRDSFVLRAMTDLRVAWA